MCVCQETLRGKVRNHPPGGTNIMALSLDSHVADCSLSPGPGGLNSTPGVCACVPKIPREWRRDHGMTIPPGGWFLAFCLSLSGKRTRPIAKKKPSPPPPPKKNHSCNERCPEIRLNIYQPWAVLVKFPCILFQIIIIRFIIKRSYSLLWKCSSWYNTALW